MTLPIYVYGADVLRDKAQDIDIKDKSVTDGLPEFIASMWETMEKADGVGLAAPQVGASQRILIVDGTLLVEDYPDLKDFKRVMINPKVKAVSEETSEYSEGCLSVPDIHAVIVRPKTITVEYYDEKLELKEEILDNFASRMVQHELDHLDGVLFVDRATPIRKKMIAGKLSNIKNGKYKTYYKTAKNR